MSELLNAFYNKKIALEAERVNLEAGNDAEAIEAEVARYRAEVEEKFIRARAEKLTALGYKLQAIDSLIADEEKAIALATVVEESVEDEANSFPSEI